MRPLLLLPAFVVLAIGCSNNKASTGGGDAGGAAATGASAPAAAATHGTVSSCDLTMKVGYCMDFEPSAPKGYAEITCKNANVNGLQGVYRASSACPTDKRLGTCTATIANVKQTYRYFAPIFTAASAEENCKRMGGTGGAGGKFTPS